MEKTKASENSRIEEIFRRFQEASPYPKGELEYTNEYTLLLAVVMSAQTTDKAVNKITSVLFNIISTPQQAIDMGEDTLREHIKSIGLYKNKSKNIIRLSNILIEKFNGKLPKTREELQSLPGVGRKTANVVMNILWNKPCIAVDTHVFRLSLRLGISSGKDVLTVEKDLMQKVPEQSIIFAHHWLILHGRYTCKAIKPMCKECFLSDICCYYNS